MSNYYYASLKISAGRNGPLSGKFEPLTGDYARSDRTIC